MDLPSNAGLETPHTARITILTAPEPPDRVIPMEYCSNGRIIPQTDADLEQNLDARLSLPDGAAKCDLSYLASELPAAVQKFFDSRSNEIVDLLRCWNIAHAEKALDVKSP